MQPAAASVGSATTATTAKATHVDTRNGGIASVQQAATAAANVRAFSPVKTPSPTANNNAPDSAFAGSPATQHMNAAVLNGVTYPSARAATIAKEAVEAAQMYYSLFFQANEDAAGSNAAGGGGGGGGASAINANAPAHRSLHRRRRSSSKSVHGHNTNNTTSIGTQLHRLDAPTAGNNVEEEGGATMPHTAPEDGPALRTTSKDGSRRASRSSSTHSNDASLLSVQTPVNVVDTAYHTFFPPVLSSVRRESIVEGIVGHRPRPYYQWEWHKAEDYHALHAQNVHHNNVYHTYPSTVAAGGGDAEAGAAAATTDNAGAPTEATTATAATAAIVAAPGQPKIQTPLSTSPSYPSMSPVARVAGSNGSRASMDGDSTASPTGTITPKVASSFREGEGLVSAGDGAGRSGSASMNPTTNTDTTPGASATLAKVPSFLNEMPFELMSQLSMYTIPTSQQGPEYFKKTAEDGTKTLIIFMMGLPARGKTFLAQKICRLLGWHGSRAKVQNIQVAWRRVLLDWEATHADQLAEDELARHAHSDSGDSHNSSGSAANAGAAPPPSTRPPLPHAPTAPPTPLATAASTNAHELNAVRRRAHHALAGQHPAHSSTQDEVSRVVRDLATGALGTTVQRRFPDNTRRLAPNPTTAAAAAVAVGENSEEASTLSTAATSKLPSLLPTPAPQTGGVESAAGEDASASASASAAAAAAAATSAASTASFSASPVCPSMEPYTSLSRDNTAFVSASTSNAASPTAARSDFASDVAVAGSPLDAALHSQPQTPTSDDGHATAAATLQTSNTASASAHRQQKQGAAAGAAAGKADRPAMPAEVLRTRHFKDLIQNPSSVARRLYRYVLQSFADDCRLFFQHGGEVVVINDDFVTEELRREAEQLFRPMASQFFYMEVIRDAEEDPLDFVQCKIRDPMEYPRGDIDLKDATDDFRERLQFLEDVYETLEEAPRTKTEERARAAQPRQPAQQLQRSYVKIRNANAIETHGISGYLASRIISYVMNLSQVKIQHPIYFVRHGESCYNLEDRIGGNPLLTEQGMRDAGALLEFLSSLKHHLKHVDHLQRGQHHPPTASASSSSAQQQQRGRCVHVHSDPAVCGSGAANHANTLEIWTSQLRRAIQTAELSERLLNIRTLRWSSLNEIHAGVCEDMTYAEVSQRYPLIDYFRKRSKYTFRYPEGESYQDLVVRLEPVIMELENADKVVVVVAHQAVLRCLLAYFGSTSAESSISVEVPHRTVWRCTYDSKGIASLDELKLDNYEAGFHMRKTTEAATTPANAGAA